MKKTYHTLCMAAVVISFFLLGTTATWAQPRPWIPPGTEIHAKATGRTHGHIAELSISNTTGRAINVEIPPVVIPTDGTHQGYAVPEPTPAKVPANSTMTVPLHGYCTKPDLPPPPPGMTLPLINTWDANSPVLPKLQSISRVTATLQQRGQIVTPFSNNPPLEREAVIQQTLWWYSMPPGRYDPCVRISQSMSDWYRDTDWYSSNTLNIEQGIAQIADAITRVGRAAGLPEFNPAVIPASSAQPVPAAPPSHPNVASTVRVVGTGRTTGHIADLTVSNPTREPITVRFGDGGGMLIPSNGRDQSYVVPSIPDIHLDPDQTATKPLVGYCVDVHRPPVGADKPMPNVQNWTGVPTAAPPAPPVPGRTLVNIPVQTAPSLPQVADVLRNLPPPPGTVQWNCPDVPVPTTLLIPGTDSPIRVPVNTDELPGIATPILVEAITNIILAYDELQPRGVINTPFSSNRDREREAVIQQTFWIFSSALKGEPYTKVDFHENTVRQFENNTNRKYGQLPPEQQTRIDQGVDDFWNSFQATGVEAKILPQVPRPSEQMPPSEDVFGDALIKPDFSDELVKEYNTVKDLQGTIAYQRYLQYKAFRDMGDSHEDAMNKGTFRSPQQRAKWADTFRRIYENEKKRK